MVILVLKLPKKSQKQYQCEHCIFIADNFSTLETHVNGAHEVDHQPQNKQDETDIIDYENTEGETSHVEAFICDSCSRKFVNKNDFNQHMLSHTEPHVLKCGQCDKNFATQVDLEWHTETTHGDEVSENLIQPHSPKNPNTPQSDKKTVEVESLHSCEQCDFDTENIDDLKSHNQRDVHFVKNRTFQEIVDINFPDEVYICGECSIRFETYIECENHTKTHIAKCYKCDFKSEDNKKLKAREKTENDLLKCNGETHRLYIKLIWN